MTRRRLPTFARAAIKVWVVLAGVAFAANARAECSREMLRKLAPSADGSSYQYQREITVHGGTGHFALILRRAGP